MPARALTLITPTSITSTPASASAGIRSGTAGRPFATTTQITFGGEREIVKDMSLGLDLVWTKGTKFTRLENFNPVIPGTKNKRKDPTKGNQWTFTDNGSSDYKAA